MWKSLRLQGLVHPDHILSATGCDSGPPVNVIMVAQKLGVPVYEAKQNVGWSGCLRCSENQAEIFVRTGEKKERAHYAVALALGHLFLHPLGKVYRDPLLESFQGEKEAHDFALGLLMPTEGLQVFFRFFGGSIPVISSVFGVSSVMLSQRLEKMGWV